MTEGEWRSRFLLIASCDAISKANCSSTWTDDLCRASLNSVRGVQRKTILFPIQTIPKAQRRNSRVEDTNGCQASFMVRGRRSRLAPWCEGANKPNDDKSREQKTPQLMIAELETLLMFDGRRSESRNRYSCQSPRLENSKSSDGPAGPDGAGR